MSFYSETAAVAHEVLREFGAPAVLTRSVPGEYDAETATAGAPVVTTYTGTAAKFDYAQREIDGTMIRYGDQRVYLSTVGVVNPQTGDTLTIGGSVFHVIASRPLMPALTAVMFDVQVRGLI